MAGRAKRVTIILRLYLVGLLGVGIWAGDGSAQVIRGGEVSCKGIALTFDMCPVRAQTGSGYDPRLVQTLIANKVPATFFLSGRWIANHDAEVRTLLMVPYFEIGTHGEEHAHLPRLDAGQQEAEIQGPVTLLSTKYGRPTTLFRPPYGEFNDLTVEAVRTLGLRFILWNVVSGDPDPKLTRDRMVANLKGAIRNGSIIVFHANGRGRLTREVVEELYRDLIVPKGFQPVTVTDLLDRCPHDPTR